MSDIQGLLHAIRDQPDDDMPRLVAADWYEEHGDAVRAAFIREQQAFHRAAWWDRDPRIERRLAALSLENQDAWVGPLLKNEQVEWNRGFPWQLSTSARQLKGRLEAVLERFPALVVHNSGAWLSSLCASSARHRLRRLVLTGKPPTAAAWKRFCASEDFGRLQSLRLELPAIGMALLPDMVWAPWFESLQSLELQDTSEQPLHLDQIRPSRTGRLREFSVSNGQLRPNDVAHLAENPYFANLEELSLFSIRLTPAKVQTLADSTQLRALKTLRICFADLNSTAGQILADSPILNKVEYLDLSFSHLGPNGCDALLQSSQLKKLLHLELTHNCTVSSLRGQSLLRSPLLDSLRCLQLGYSRLKEADVLRLLASGRGQALRLLSLQGNELKTATAEALAGATHLSEMRTLVICGNQMGLRGAQALADSLAFPHLWELIGDASTFSKRGEQFLREHLGERYTSI